MMMPQIRRTANLAPIIPDREMLHQMACIYAEEQFKLNGAIEPTWLIAAGSNMAWVETPFDDPVVSKDRAAHVMRGMLAGTHAQAYSFISEVYVAGFDNERMSKADQEKWIAFASEHGVSALPPELRDDALQVLSHDRGGGYSMSRYLVTLRHGKGLDFLGPHQDEQFSGVSGRMANLFAFEESKP